MPGRLKAVTLKRFHRDMQSAGIYNVGLGLPDSKMPAIHQICMANRYHDNNKRYQITNFIYL